MPQSEIVLRIAIEGEGVRVNVGDAAKPVAPLPVPKSGLYGELRMLMKANGMDTEQTARRIGRRTSYFSQRMNGHASFTVAEAYTLLDLFGVPHERLHEVFPPVRKDVTERRKHYA